MEYKKISEIGEFRLIERFRRKIKLDSSVIKGSGDDCAVLAFDRKSYQLFTCDMIVEGEDFTAQDDPCFVGRKALAISISDIAACGGFPRHAVVSLGLPKNTKLDYIDKVSRGLFALARQYKINIVGGDISKAPRLVINTSLLGLVEKKNVILRSGAKKGDIIFVSGTLGGSIKAKHLRFTPRVKEARYLVNNFKINAMIDISDGLSQDLGQIMRQSNVGAVIYENLIPVNKFAKGLDDALYSGEDFELLFTARPKEAKKIAAQKKFHFYPIGEVTGKTGRLSLVDRRNQGKIIAIKGFRHF